MSSPESHHSQKSRQPDMYTEIQCSSSYVRKPFTYRPNIAQNNLNKPRQYFNNRNLNRHSEAISHGILNDNYVDMSGHPTSWSNAALYGHLQPMDFTGDSALHSFFDKTPIAYSRDDDDNYSTTTSGSYTIYSEEIL